MRKILVLFAFVLLPNMALAQSGPNGFDPSDLTVSEKKMLQGALAFSGDYTSFVDGAWGNGSQAAFRSYSRREFGKEPTMWHAAVAVAMFEAFLQDDDWKLRRLGESSLAFLVPTDAIKRTDAKNFFDIWRHENSSLEFGVTRSSDSRDQVLHSFVASLSQNQVYSLRRSNLRVTSALGTDGKQRYLRSDKIDNVWKSVVLIARPEDQALITGVVSTMSLKKIQALNLTQDGIIERSQNRIRQTFGNAALFNPKILANADLERFAARESDRSNPIPLPLKPLPRNTVQFGSGFVVNAQGFVLTSNLVVANCPNPRVNGQSAKIHSEQSRYGLALLQSSSVVGKPVLNFAQYRAVRHGTVEVPSYGLGKGKYNKVSASTQANTLPDAANLMEIAIGKRNIPAGVPVLNQVGNVIGISTGNRDPRFAQTGLFPNVSGLLAIRGEFAQLFMYENGVFPAVRPATRRSSVNSDEVLNESLVRITCD
ncbi:MAG: serine protease [Pseudomonadota bacterium]